MQESRTWFTVPRKCTRLIKHIIYDGFHMQHKLQRRLNRRAVSRGSRVRVQTATVATGRPRSFQTSRNLSDVSSGLRANINEGRLERWARSRTWGTKHCLTTGIAQSVQWLYDGLDVQESVFDSQQMQTIFSVQKCPGRLWRLRAFLFQSTGSSSAGSKESQEWK